MDGLDHKGANIFASDKVMTTVYVKTYLEKNLIR